MSPDGLRLAFSAYLSPGSGNGQSRVYVAAVDGSSLTTITPAGDEDYDPEWSPDGSQLVFVRYNRATRRNDLMIGDVNGTQFRVLESSRYAGTPSWSPDGRYIMFADGGILSLIAVGGGQLHQLSGPLSGSSDSSPVWKR